MYRQLSALAAILTASALAGPIFVLSLWLIEILLRVPQPLPLIDLIDISTLPSVVVIGFILAFVPIAFGAWMMAAFSGIWDGARSPLAWAFAGGVASFGLLLILSDGPIAPDALAFSATGTLCALMCWIMIVPCIESPDQA